MRIAALRALTFRGKETPAQLSYPCVEWAVIKLLETTHNLLEIQGTAEDSSGFRQALGCQSHELHRIYLQCLYASMEDTKLGWGELP